MADLTYDYYETDGGHFIRVPREDVGTDVYEDGSWVPIDPKVYGATQPWAVKIAMGEMKSYFGSEDPTASRAPGTAQTL